MTSNEIIIKEIRELIGPEANTDLNYFSADGFHSLVDWAFTQEWFPEFSARFYNGKDNITIISDAFESQNYFDFAPNLAWFNHDKGIAIAKAEAAQKAKDATIIELKPVDREDHPA